MAGDRHFVGLRRIVAGAALAGLSVPGWLTRVPTPMIDLAAAAAPPMVAPVFHPEAPPKAQQDEFTRKAFKLDQLSGNYLSPRVFAKLKHENLVPVMIDGRYVKDLRGSPIFVRESIRAKLLDADAAMFKKKQKHLVINYGFRSNALQAELYRKIKGNGQVAEVGGSFHEAGMALDLSNWHDAQRFMIDAGFVGGCYGLEEDMVHYSIDEVSKGSNMDAFKRCTLKEIPEDMIKGVKKAGVVTGHIGKAALGKITGK